MLQIRYSNQRELKVWGTAEDVFEGNSSAPSGEELRVSGAAEELRDVGRRIADLVRSDAVQISIEAQPLFDPSPYDSVVKRMTVVKWSLAEVSLAEEVEMRLPAPKRKVRTLSWVEVSLAGEEMRVEGSHKSLEDFAGYFDFEPDAVAGDWACYKIVDYEGHRWVGRPTIPLVISLT